MRKVIQVTPYYDREDETDLLYALCDDGTVWQVYHVSIAEGWRWDEITPIPQSEDGDSSD